jgi:hypothetical protein
LQNDSVIASSTGLLHGLLPAQTVAELQMVADPGNPQMVTNVRCNRKE